MQLHRIIYSLFLFYENKKKEIYPILLASELHEQLATIHPFIDGNGRTARLVMNLILLKAGYPIANIQGNTEISLGVLQRTRKV